MKEQDTYLVRTPSTGRSATVQAEPDEIFVDRETGETMFVVSKVTPLAPSPSELPWSPATLRSCGCVRDQLIQSDVNDCPYCSKRLDPVK